MLSCRLSRLNDVDMGEPVSRGPISNGAALVEGEGTRPSVNYRLVDWLDWATVTLRFPG